MQVRFGWWLVAVMGLVAAPGCRSDEGTACAVDSDCESGLVCSQYTALCTARDRVCETDNDCKDPGLPRCDRQAFECVATLATADTVQADATAPDAAEPADVPVSPSDVAEPDVTATCTPAELPACPALPTTMLRATSFAIGLNGEPGSGIDVDRNPATCAPSRSGFTCSAGIDNSLGTLASTANPSIADAIAKGELNLLLAPLPDAPVGCPFGLLSRLGVKPATEGGAYTVAPGEETPPCAQGSLFLDACSDGTSMWAGEACDSEYLLVLSLLGANLQVPVHDARVRGTVAKDADGRWTRLDAIIGGYVFRRDLHAAIDAIEGLPVDPKAIVDQFVLDDLDTDGNGTPDAISVGVTLTAEPVPVSGFADAE